MKPTVKQRLIDFYKIEELQPNEVAKLLELPRSNIYKWLDPEDTGRIRIDFVQKTAQHYPNLSTRWLLLGKGSKWLAGTEQVGDKQTGDSGGADMSIESQINSLLMQKFSKGELDKLKGDELLRLLVLHFQEFDGKFAAIDDRLKKLEDTSKVEE